MYDIAIIGAGINGCATAYELTQAGKRVILFDMDSVAAGGSGAAGAFISPKFSKTGELKELLQEAFLYSMEFYEKNFPNLLTKAPLLHIAKDDKDDEMLRNYKSDTDLELLDISEDITASISESSRDREQISINTGVVDAEAMCCALSKSAKFVKSKVDSLVYDEGVWVINETYSAKEVVLATGAYEKLIKEPYIEVRGIWGHRIDVKTTTKNTHSIHQFVSISPSKDGVLAVGATHNVHYHPQTAKEPYDVDAGRKELLEKASRTILLKDVEILKDYTGLRSGTVDYMPIVGSLVLSAETLYNPKIRLRIKKQDYTQYSYYPNLYMINGSGGYGFVLAPYLAKVLSENILSNKKISEKIQPARFFARWARRELK